MDAVNELRGDLNTRERTSSCNQVIVALSSFEGYEMGHIDVGSGNRNNNSIYWGVICTFDQFRNCVKGCSNNFGLPSVTAKAIYTQAMFDAGELPKIGMQCKIFYNEEGSRFNDFFDVEITILAITGDVFTFESSLFGLGALKLKSKMLSAIDNRTPKEKADDLFKLYLKGEQVSTHKSFSQAAIDGDFGDNIKWVK